MKRIVAIVFIIAICFSLSACCLRHDWQEATCAAPETCAKCGKTRGEPLAEHTWVEATCTEPKTCSVCGATEGEALGHTFDEASCTYPKTCTVCGETEGEPLGHTWIEATCTEPKTCSVCGVTEGEPLGHAWVEATCTEPKTCSACGETEGEALEHSWVEATAAEPKTCTVCGETEGEPLGPGPEEESVGDLSVKAIGDAAVSDDAAAIEDNTHVHSWTDATCISPMTCPECGATVGKAPGHAWLDATCTEPMTCPVCGAYVGTASGHEWIGATCTEPRTCSVCGATEGEPLGHTWIDATCTAPKTCSVCGATEGEPLGHTWADATCTEPKTCSVCGETEGEPLGHTWVDATCTEPKTCSVCADTEGEPLGHKTSAANYQHGEICYVCNEEVTAPVAAAFEVENKTEKTHDIASSIGEKVEYITAKSFERDDLTRKGLVSAEWIVPYNAGYSDVADEIAAFVPEVENVKRYPVYSSTNPYIFDNVDGYEWRGIETVGEFDGGFWQEVSFLDYFTLTPYDLDFDPYQVNCLYAKYADFSVNFNGEDFEDCRLVSIIDDPSGESKQYSFFRVPEGYNGCVIAVLHTRLDSDGSGTVYFRLK